MSSRANRNMAAANDWAAKKKEAMERARRIKEERKAAGDGYSATSRPDSSRTAGAAPQPPYATSYDSNTPGSNGGGYEQGYSAPKHGRRPSRENLGQHHTDPYSHNHAGGGYPPGLDDPMGGMPAIDLRPVRVRRPPSSSRIHSQGPTTDALSLQDDWSSPPMARKHQSPSYGGGGHAIPGYQPPPHGYQPPPHGYGGGGHGPPAGYQPPPHGYQHPPQGYGGGGRGLPGYQPPPQGYGYGHQPPPQGGGGYGGYSHEDEPSRQSSSSHYDAAAYGGTPGRKQQQQEGSNGGLMGANARRASPSHGRRSQKPEWNSDFTEPVSEPPLDLDLDHQGGSSRENSAPRAGRRSGRPAKQQPDWNFDTESPGALDGNGHDDYDYGAPQRQQGRGAGGPSQASRQPGSGSRRPPKPEWSSEAAEPSYIDSVATRAQRQDNGGRASPSEQQHQQQSRPNSVRNLASKGLAKLKAMRGLSRGGGSERQEEKSSTPGSRSARRSRGEGGGGGGGGGSHGYYGAPGGGFGGGGAPTEQPPEFAEAPVQLIPCDGCGRKFNEKALARHAKVCKKVFQDKRKPMDMAQQRVGGTEAAKHYSGGGVGGAAAARPSPIKQAAMERKQAQAAASSGRGGAGAYSASDYEDPDDFYGRPQQQQRKPSSGRGSSGRPQPQKKQQQQRPPWQDDEPSYGGGGYGGDYGDEYGDDYGYEPPPRGGGGGGGGRGAPSGGGGGGNMDGVPEFAPTGNLQRCGGCGRSFNPEAFAKHSRVCKKVFQQARKPMDMTKQRVAGTEAAKFVGKGGGGGSSRASGRPPARGGASSRHEDRVISTKETNKPKWKQQSQGLRAAMKANRMMTQALAEGKDIRDIPVVPSAPDPSLVPCPHCGRSFNEKAAERHIPRCKDIQAKPKFLSRGSGKGAYARK